VARLIRERLARRRSSRGRARCRASGRVYDEADVLAAVEASLDFWLTLGPYGERFERSARRAARRAPRDPHELGLLGESARGVGAHMSPKLERALQPGDEVITVAAGFPTTVSPDRPERSRPRLRRVLAGNGVADPGVVEAAIDPGHAP